MSLPKTIIPETSDRALVVKLVAAVCVKLVVLAGIWMFFFKDYHVNVDAATVTSHLQDQIQDRS
ncbi:MAG: hypothetical protein KGI37_02650 [Alphaproteobacteria bacterium]|nr:hypothetical protein [Alphaproteobacteria bacterium]